LFRWDDYASCEVLMNNYENDDYRPAPKCHQGLHVGNMSGCFHCGDSGPELVHTPGLKERKLEPLKPGTYITSAGPGKTR
jgi:hypothetical protein